MKGTTTSDSVASAPSLRLPAFLPKIDRSRINDLGNEADREFLIDSACRLEFPVNARKQRKVAPSNRHSSEGAPDRIFKEKLERWTSE